ncbi:hypothetical protein N2152v2_001041 [Parachlorella kessleri]
MAESCKQYLNDPLPPGSDPGQIISGFRQAVNMTPQEIEAFLCRDESRHAVEDGDDKEKEGRHMARRIVELLNKKEDTFYEGDLEHMYQVTQYINCHKGDLQHASDWEDKLRNFGFDPAKVTAGREQ